MTTQLSCSLCGRSVDAGENGWAKSAVCPSCNLRTRHRAVASYLSHSGVLNRARSILACSAVSEERRYLFGEKCKLTNFDIRPTDFTDLDMDIQDMKQVETGSVDLFVALHVLNHVADDVQALKEIKRVLKPGDGVFVATVPVRRGQATEKLDDPTAPYGAEILQKYGVGSFRRYGLNDFRALMEAHFAVTEYRFADSLVGEVETVFQGRRLAA